jgi:hypothetical protein
VAGVSPGIGKQFRKFLIKFIESSCGVGAMAEKLIILGLGQGQTKGYGILFWADALQWPWLPRCVRCDWVLEPLTSRNRGGHSTPLQAINRIRYNQQLY